MTSLIPGTQFTVDFILEQMRKATGCEKLAVENLEGFEANDITGGSAFMSQILKLELHWSNANIQPKSLILKVPDVDKVKAKTVQIQQAAQRHVPGIQNARDFQEKSLPKDESLGEDWLEGLYAYLELSHTREIKFYEIFPAYDRTLKLPEVYYGYEYSRHHDKGIMIMEDLTPYAKTVKMLPGFDNDQVEAVIDELAKVHACSWLHRDWIEKLPHMEPDPGFIQEMGHMTEVLRSIKPEWFNDLLDRCAKLFNVNVGQKVMYKEDKYGFPAASVHSDLWAANVLWKTDSEGNATSDLSALIDWQGVHAGNPGADLARMLAINTSGEYRRANTDRLLQRYTDKVAEHIDGKAPFTFEQIKEAYSSSLGHVMCFIGFGAPMYYNMTSVVGTGPAAEANKIELLSRVRMFFEDTCVASGV